MPKAIDENRVFEVTATLFVRHGYAGTKTKEIAEAAGVNEATLFRRYGSKAMLIGAAMGHQWRDVPLADLGPSNDLEADLVTIVEAYLETNRLLGAIVPALLVELARSADLRDAFGAALDNVRGLAAILQHHQTAGRLRAEAPMTALVALIGPRSSCREPAHWPKAASRQRRGRRWTTFQHRSTCLAPRWRTW